MDVLDYEELRPEFRTAVAKLHHYIVNYIQAKKVEDCTMNGPLFCEYLKQIVENINKESIIYLNETINYCLQTCGKEILTEMTNIYSEEMSKLMTNEKYYKTKDLERKEKIIFHNTKVILAEKLLLQSPQLVTEFENKLIELRESGQINDVKNAYFRINTARINKKNIKDAKQIILHLMRENVDFDTANQFYDWIKQEVKCKLFECNDFAQFWSDLETKIDLNKLNRMIEKKDEENHKKELEKVKLEKKILEAKLKEKEEQDRKKAVERNQRDAHLRGIIEEKENTIKSRS